MCAVATEEIGYVDVWPTTVVVPDGRGGQQTEQVFRYRKFPGILRSVSFSLSEYAVLQQSIDADDDSPLRPRRRTKAGTPVVLKTLKRDHEHAETISRLDREVQALLRLNGVNAPRLVEAWFASASDHYVAPWFAMEWIDAPTIASIAPLNGAVLDTFVRSSWYGLRSIHAREVIHRDLKPENILFDPLSRRVTFIDFGSNYQTGAQTVTGAQGAPGTYGFAAPEARHETRVQPAADIWSWACTVAFAASGRCPFSTNVEIWDRSMQDQLDPNLSGVPGHLVDLLRLCFTYDPSLRTENISQIEAALPPDPLEAAKAQRDTAKRAAATAQAALRLAEQQLAELSVTLATVTAERDEVNGHLKGAAAVQKRIEQLLKAKVKSDGQLRTLQIELSDATARLETNRSSLESEIAALSSALAASNEQLDHARAEHEDELAGRDQRNDQLAQEIVNMKAQLAKAQKTASQAKAQKKQIEELKATVDSAAAKLSAAEDRIKKLNTDGSTSRSPVPTGLAVLFGLATVGLLAALLVTPIRHAVQHDRDRSLVTLGSHSLDPGLADLAVQSTDQVTLSGVDRVDDDVASEIIVRLGVQLKDQERDLSVAAGNIMLLVSGAPSGPTLQVPQPTPDPSVHTVTNVPLIHVTTQGEVGGAMSFGYDAKSPLALVFPDTTNSQYTDWTASTVAAGGEIRAEGNGNRLGFRLPRRKGFQAIGVVIMNGFTATALAVLRPEMIDANRPWFTWPFPVGSTVTTIESINSGCFATPTPPAVTFTAVTFPTYSRVVPCGNATWQTTGWRDPTTGSCDGALYGTGWQPADDWKPSPAATRSKCIYAKPQQLLAQTNSGTLNLTVSRGPMPDTYAGLDGQQLLGMEIHATNPSQTSFDPNPDTGGFRLVLLSPPGTTYARGASESTPMSYDEIYIGMLELFIVRPDSNAFVHPDAAFGTDIPTTPIPPGGAIGGPDAAQDTLAFTLPVTVAQVNILGLAYLAPNLSVAAYTPVASQSVGFPPEDYSLPDATTITSSEAVAPGACIWTPYQNTPETKARYRDELPVVDCALATTLHGWQVLAHVDGSSIGATYSVDAAAALLNATPSCAGYANWISPAASTWSGSDHVLTCMKHLTP